MKEQIKEVDEKEKQKIKEKESKLKKIKGMKDRTDTEMYQFYKTKKF